MVGATFQIDAEAEDGWIFREQRLGDVERALVDIEFQKLGAGLKRAEVREEVTQAEGGVNIFRVEGGQDNFRHCAWKLAARAAGRNERAAARSVLEEPEREREHPGTEQAPEKAAIHAGLVIGLAEQGEQIRAGLVGALLGAAELFLKLVELFLFVGGHGSLSGSLVILPGGVG